MVAAVIILAAAVSPAMAYTRTGYAGASRTGFFQGCGASYCWWFNSYVSGLSEWNTHLDNPGALLADGGVGPQSIGNMHVAPFQQSALLHNGKDLWTLGAGTPSANMHSLIYTMSGVNKGDLVPTGGSCWQATYPGNDLYWVKCSTSGWTFYGGAYPPGQAHSYETLTLSGISGFFAVDYWGTLR